MSENQLKIHDIFVCVFPKSAAGETERLEIEIGVYTDKEIEKKNMINIG